MYGRYRLPEEPDGNEVARVREQTLRRVALGTVAGFTILGFTAFGESLAARAVTAPPSPPSTTCSSLPETALLTAMKTAGKPAGTTAVLTAALIPVDTPTTSPSDSSSASPTDTPSQSPTDTTAASPTDSSSPSPTDTPSPSPTDTPSPSPTDSSSPSPTDTPTASPTDSSSSTSPSSSPSTSPTSPPAGQITPQLCVLVQSLSSASEVQAGTTASFVIWVWSTKAASTGVVVKGQVAAAPDLGALKFTVCPSASGATCRVGNLAVGQADELEATVPVKAQASLGEELQVTGQASAPGASSFSGSTTDVVVLTATPG